MVWHIFVPREIMLEQTGGGLGQLKMADASEPKPSQIGVLSACVFCCEHIFVLFLACFSPVRVKQYQDIELIITGSFHSGV